MFRCAAFTPRDAWGANRGRSANRMDTAPPLDQLVGRLFNIIDTDGNGSLSQTEMMTWWSAQYYSDEKTVSHASWTRMLEMLKGRTHEDLDERHGLEWLRQQLEYMINDEWTPITDEAGRSGFQNKDSGAVTLTRPSIESWVAEHLPPQGQAKRHGQGQSQRQRSASGGVHLRPLAAGIHPEHRAILLGFARAVGLQRLARES